MKLTSSTICRYYFFAEFAGQEQLLRTIAAIALAFARHGGTGQQGALRSPPMSESILISVCWQGLSHWRSICRPVKPQQAQQEGSLRKKTYQEIEDAFQRQKETFEVKAGSISVLNVAEQPNFRQPTEAILDRRSSFFYFRSPLKNIFYSL